MFGVRTKARVASWHRWLGLALSVPLLGWVVSSIALMSITMDLPNGLQGVYRLAPYNSVDLALDGATVQPDALLRRLERDYGLDRIHWLRLESRGPHLWYVVRPTPFSLAMVFDARSGARLDPLSDELLAMVADEALIDTRFERLEARPEFNRDYEIDRVPAAAVRVAGAQPAVLMLSRDEGRTLRRLDADAASFHWWYRLFHVNQYTDHVVPWTTVLYVCAFGVIVLALLGYQLFWWRRMRVEVTGGSTRRHFTARNLHRKAGIAVGGVLIVQLLAGVYIWLSLGPLNPRFRGKGSFAAEWAAGIPTGQRLAEPGTVLARVGAVGLEDGRPVQAITWRRLGEIDAWFVTTRRDERPRVFDAATGAQIEALPPEVAGEVARQEMAGQPTYAYLGPLHFESMDLNRRLPAYRFRFDDPEVTDVYVLQNTGEIVMRRPAFWRLFGPFLAVHMLAVTRNKVIDMTLLALFQAGFLLVILTGWRLQFPGRRGVAAGPQAGVSSEQDEPFEATEHLAGAAP